MIYTVTFNPSLDYILQVQNFALGALNRSEHETVYPGGKGINVSIMLQNWGIQSVALGFTAGFTGAQVQRLLKQYGCKTDFLAIDEGLTRINVKIKAETETEINGQGPVISPAAIDLLYVKLDALQDGDILVLAGSIPNTLPSDIYQRIMERLKKKDIRVVVDATGALLRNVLQYRPFLIKPNNHELGELFGVEVSGTDVIAYAKQLQQMGARNVLVSMAAQGAVLLAENGEILYSLPPKGRVVGSVGSGDSMVAGFLAGLLQSGRYEDAFVAGLASGSASAFTQWLAVKEQIEPLLSQISVQHLKP